MTLKLLPAVLFCLAATSAYAQPCTLTPTASVVTSPICSGRPVQFTASNIPGATYTWRDPSNNIFSNTQNGILPSIPVFGAGVYTVTITDGGCTYTVNVPIVGGDINFTPTTPAVSQQGPKCPEQDDKLTAVSTGAQGITYSWTFPDGSTHLGNTQDMLEVKQSMKGNYTVVATSLQGCSSDPATIFFDVYQGVEADFDLSIDLDCKEDVVSFTNKVSGATSYQWSFGDGGTSIDFAPSHAYTVQPATYTVRLIGANAHCKDTVEKTVALNHPLAADFTISDDSICQNSDVVFTNTTSAPTGGAHTYTWYFDDGSDAAATPDASHTYKYKGIYTATLVVKDFLGCYDTAKKKIVVDSAGYADFSISNNNVCTGQKLDVEGYYSPIGYTGMTWKLGDGNTLASKTKFPYAYDKAGDYDINFTIDYRICPAVTVTKNIKVKPLPRVDLGPDTSICNNAKPVLLRDYINEGNKNAKWLWNKPNAENTSAYLVTAPGIYRAEVTIDGCTGSDEVVVNRSCFIDLPNAFTPNGDGIGDYFLPRQLLSANLADFKMTIYNRWGGKVFETTTISGRGWDGTMNGVTQPVGVYAYIIQARFANNNAETYSGNITLLR